LYTSLVSLGRILTFVKEGDRGTCSLSREKSNSKKYLKILTLLSKRELILMLLITDERDWMLYDTCMVEISQCPRHYYSQSQSGNCKGSKKLQALLDVEKEGLERLRERLPQPRHCTSQILKYVNKDHRPSHPHTGRTCSTLSSIHAFSTPWERAPQEPCSQLILHW